MILFTLHNYNNLAQKKVEGQRFFVLCVYFFLKNYVYELCLHKK